MQPSRTYLQNFIGYVEQFDVLIENLTVHEMMLYTAELKSPADLSFECKKSRVLMLTNCLSLDTCRNQRISSRGVRSISGGQAKRLSIGLALLGMTNILLLDEPTSGLDSYTANEIILAVKSLSSSGMTICTAIHSPTQLAVSMLDQVVMLLQGRIVFAGDNDQGLSGFLHVSRACGIRSHGESHAEQLIAAISQVDRQNRQEELKQLYEASSWSILANKVVASDQHPLLKGIPVTPLGVAVVWFRQAIRATSIIFKYRLVADYTDIQFLGPRVLDKFAIATLMLLLYHNIGSIPTSGNVNNISSLLFMWATLPGFTAVSYVPSIYLDRPLLRRERFSGLYRTSSYLLFKIVEESFVALITSLAFSAMVFFGISLKGNFVLFWMVYWVTTCNGISLAYVFSAALPTLESAAAALPAYVLTLQFFVGLLIRRADMPKYVEWYSTINFLKYAWDALMVNHFEETRIIIYDDMETLAFYGLDTTTKWQSLGKETAVFPVVCVFAWLALKFCKYTA